MYPPETVVAEKWQAMVELGLANSRMKDFYDVWLLARHLEFDSAILSQAIRATFERRQTPLPSLMPPALRDEFCLDAAKMSQWRVFARRNRLHDVPELAEIVEEIAAFVWPLVQSPNEGIRFDLRWIPEQGWREKESTN